MIKKLKICYEFSHKASRELDGGGRIIARLLITRELVGKFEGKIGKFHNEASGDSSFSVGGFQLKL
jgi:hypothetical protein